MIFRKQLRQISLATLITFAAPGLLAATTFTCPVQGAHQVSPAERAFLEGDYLTAAKLYQERLAHKPTDAEAVYGLTRLLLQQQKLKEAEEVAQKAVSSNPDSPLMLTALGEVQYRAGEPWLASQTAQKVQRINPCIAQSRLLNARILKASSMYGTAAGELATAHALDPHDPAIWLMWIDTLPSAERIVQLRRYLNSKTGDDTEKLESLRRYVESLEKQQTDPHKACHLVSTAQSTDIPFIHMMVTGNTFRTFGLEVKLNGHPTHLQIDTGAGGLVVGRSVASRAGLHRLSNEQAEGIGDKGAQAAYTAYADRIQIGGLEFKDCEVEVLDENDIMYTDGLIGMDVFSQFLVTLDYPIRKLSVGPLPVRPGNTTPQAPSLNTASNDRTSDVSNDRNPAKLTDLEPTNEGASLNGPQDRYVAPEMKDWETVYRVGHQLLMPAVLNDKVAKLFILDTGAFSTTIQPDVAREVTKVERDQSMSVHGISGEVEKVYTADDIDFKLGHVEQKNHDVVAFAMPQISRSVGMEVAGLIGITTLGQMTVKIDYRDGLVKFEYDPKRGFKYPGMN